MAKEDQNIQSRARRRLIGAIALALAVVVILPMVLDSEPKINGKDIALSIPSADKAGTFVPAVSEVIETSLMADSGVNPVSEVAPSPEVVPASDEVPQATASGKITHAEAKAGKQVEIPPVEVKKPEPRPTVPAESVKLKSTESSPSAAEAKGTEYYIVQVAAFANAETATLQADQLKAWGFKVYTELVNGTTRVRVGPYTDRESAEKVRTLLEKHNLHPVIKADK